MSVDLAALFQQHKKTLAFAGAAAVGGLALMQARGRDSSGGDAPTMPHLDRASTGGGPASAWPIAGGFAPYDSGSSDLYNAIQPQLEYLQRLQERQAEQDGGAVPVSSPSPAEGMKAGFYKDTGGNLFQIAAGRIDYLTRDEFKAMTKGQKGVKTTTLSRDNPVFQNGAHWLDQRKQQTAATPTPNTAK